MEAKNKYDDFVINICKILLRFLMAVLTVCILLGAADLMRILYKDVTIPPFGVLDVKNLLITFNLVLILAVGFELVKSLHTLITSKIIPSIPLVQIAIIALANKMITLDFKEVGYQKIIGMSLLMLSLGSSYYFMRKTDALHQTEAGH